jgi:hypothetical protein
MPPQIFLTNSTVTGNGGATFKFPGLSIISQWRRVVVFSGGDASTHEPRQLFLTDYTLTGAHFLDLHLHRPVAAVPFLTNIRFRNRSAPL